MASACAKIRSYFDILAANSSIFLLYGLTQDNLAEIATRSDKFNTLRFYFSPEFSKQQEMMGTNWEDIVRFNIMDFRTSSLRYRGTPYFSELLSELRGYPLFKKYWREVYWREKDHIINGGNMSLDSPLWGKLKCIASNYTALTIHGYLILCLYNPISLETFEAFNKIIKQAGTEVYRLGDWPK